MPQHKARLLVAFAAVYLIWGSTYLAIRWAIETMPTFLMAGVRFLVAGTVLYVWGRWRGAPGPRAAHWRDAVIIGALLLLGGNGGVVWAEQYVPSGLTALDLGRVTADRAAAIREAFRRVEAMPHALMVTPAVLEGVAVRR